MTILSTCFEQDTTLLGAVWWRGGQTAGYGGEAPFLDIGFNKHKARLTKIDMNCGRTVGTNGWEEVLRLKPMYNFFKSLAISRKKDGACARTVPNANDIALY